MPEKRISVRKFNEILGLSQVIREMRTCAAFTAARPHHREVPYAPTGVPWPNALRIARHELHRNGVHAVTRVARRKALPYKHVAEVPSTAGAEDFRPVPVRVRQPRNRALDLLVEAWPSTMGVELVLRPV